MAIRGVAPFVSAPRTRQVNAQIVVSNAEWLQIYHRFTLIGGLGYWPVLDAVSLPGLSAQIPSRVAAASAKSIRAGIPPARAPNAGLWPGRPEPCLPAEAACAQSRLVFVLVSFPPAKSRSDNVPSSHGCMVYASRSRYGDLCTGKEPSAASHSFGLRRRAFGGEPGAGAIQRAKFVSDFHGMNLGQAHRKSVPAHRRPDHRPSLDPPGFLQRRA